MSRAVWFGCALAGTGVLVVSCMWLRGGDAGATHARPGSTVHEVEPASRMEPAAARRREATTPAEEPANLPKQAAEPRERAAAERTAPPEPPGQAQTSAEVVAEYDRSLQEEARDEAWARPKEDAIAVALSDVSRNLGLPIRLVKAECRSSLCKVVTDHGTREDAEAFLERRSAVSPLKGSGYVRIQDGTVSIYVAREGQRLPVL